MPTASLNNRLLLAFDQEYRRVFNSIFNRGCSFFAVFFKDSFGHGGKRTTARIVNIRPTGMRVNNYYDGIQFDLELQYMGETIQTSTEKLVPRFGAPDYQIGMSVNVMYEPNLKTVLMLN